MRHNPLKLMAFTCAAALTFATANTAQAQNANIPVTLTTSSALTVAAGVGMDFGEWFLRPVNDDLVTLVLSPATGATVAAIGVGPDTTADGSAFVDIGATSVAGTVTVESPSAATLNMYSVITDFTDAQLLLDTPTYELNATGGAAALSILPLTPTSFSSTGGTPDTVAVGATVTATDANTDGTGGPTDSAHTANIQMVFSY